MKINVDKQPNRISCFCLSAIQASASLGCYMV